MKKILSLLLLSALCLSLAACGDVVISGSAPSAVPGGTAPADGDRVTVTMNGSSASCDGSGVAIHERSITITSAGTYLLTGSLEEGQLTVNTGEDVKTDVTLILSDLTMTNSAGAVISVERAKNVYLVLADGTVNTLTSGTEATMAAVNDSSSGAAIFSESDLKISGGGSLTVNGLINNGITCKDDLDIDSGELVITAANNGIKGSESVSVTGGSITVTAGNDGIKSSSAVKEGKGYVTVEGGTITVCCGGDGISAETSLSVHGGDVSVTTTGDAALVSCKALKSNTELVISGGNLVLSADDHCIRGETGVTVSGGVIEAESLSGKAILSRGDISLEGGVMALTAGEDGIASDTAISMLGGTATVSAVKDGLHAGVKSTGFGAVSGSFTQTGGTLLISAGTDPVDAQALFAIDGGTFFAVGSGSNRRTPTGSQVCLLAALSGVADTELTVSGGASASMIPQRSFSFVLYSEASLTAGGSYTAAQGALNAAATSVS